MTGPIVVPQGSCGPANPGPAGRTLARHRKWDGATWFAMQLVPELDGVRGVVAVGDGVTPER